MTVIENYSKFVADLRETLLAEASAKSEVEKRDDEVAVATRRGVIENTLASMDKLTFDRAMSDETFWRIAASKPFYTGHIAAAVQVREQHMLDYYLGDREALCAPEWNEDGVRYRQFLNDEGCYCNERDLKRVLLAARNIERIKSFNPQRSIIDHFLRQVPDWTSAASLQVIYRRMEADLAFGPVTTFHVMTDLGFPVVKPDRVVNRLAARMGLIDGYSHGRYTHIISPTISSEAATALGNHDGFNWAIQDVFSTISVNSGISMRSLDYIIVKLGQEPDEVNGIARTICAEKAPLCSVCSAKPTCSYAKVKR